MKEIFQGEVYEILPLPNGIIFSYCKDVVDGQIVVSFKMLSFDTGRFTDVAKNIYLLTKFGNNYKEVIKNCDNYITVKSIVLPNGKVFLMTSDGMAQLIDTDAVAIWKGMLTYRSTTASDIVLYKNTLWASYSECNVMLRYNLNNMREELRIGGKNSPFNKPKNLFVEGESVIVSNQGSQKLTQVNLESYVVLDCEEFPEPVKQYVKVKDYRFVILNSGIYLI